MEREGNPRIRCPCCGRLAWLSSYRRKHLLQLFVQVCYGGRANKNWVKLYPINDLDRLEDIRKFLIQHLRTVLNQLGYVEMQYPSAEIELPMQIVRQKHNLPVEVEYG